MNHAFRTNYFLVRNPKTFLEWYRSLNVNTALFEEAYRFVGGKREAAPEGKAFIGFGSLIDSLPDSRRVISSDLAALDEQGRALAENAYGELDWHNLVDTAEAIDDDYADFLRVTGQNPNGEAEFNFTAELAAHLQEGEVAAVISIGNDKLRSLYGHAYAVNHAGEVLSARDLMDTWLNANYSAPEW